MSVDLSYAIGLPPEKAIAYFEAKGLKITGDWRELWQEQHARAFTVARLAKMDALNDVYSALKEALNNGTTEYQFIKALTPLLQAKGWWGQAIDPSTGEVLERYDDTGRPVQWGSPRRLKLIYRQNMQTAYMAGRYKQQAELAASGSRPYWQYLAIRDNRTRPSHSALHGRVWRADDPIWNSLYPPNGWNCRCRVRALSDRRIEQEGLKAENSAGQLVTREVSAGKLPDGTPDMRPVTGIKYLGLDGKDAVMLPDAGWSYNPGKAGDAAMRALVVDKVTKLNPDLADLARASSLTPLGDGHHVLDTWDGMGQRPGLYDLPPMPIIDVPHDAFGGAIGKVALAKAADAALRELQASGGLANDDAGWMLSINNKARKKMGDNADQTPADSKAIAVLAALVKSAVIGERHEDKKHANPDVRAIYRMFAAMSIEGSVYRVQLTAKEYLDAANPHKLHALESFEIENALLGILPAYSSDESLQPAQPTTGRTISIKQLLHDAIRHDGKPYEDTP